MSPGQARVLDSLAYILVSQAKKDVFAVGVVVTNPGSSRADSDSDSGSERSSPAIEVLVANNDVIEERYMQISRERIGVPSRNPKGESRNQRVTTFTDGCHPHGHY